MRESLRETVNHALCIEMKLPNIEKIWIKQVLRRHKIYA